MKFITLGINSVILLLLVSISAGRRRHKRLLEKYYEFETVKRHLINGLSSNDKRMVAKRDEANEDDDLTKVTLDEDLTYQSTTAGRRKASKAISGDCLLNGYSESTKSELPMWYVDMENEWLIAKVVIGVQSASGAGNFREAYLRVTDLEPSLQDRNFGKDFCGYFKGPAKPLQKVNMYCGKRGTFISVILKGNSMILEMCNLLAYSEPKEKQESRLDVSPKLAKQVSTEFGRVPERAITGDCSESEQHSEPYWTKWPLWYVDLRKEYRVTKVVIGTRKYWKAKRFHNVHIQMLNEEPKFTEAARSIYHDGCAFYKGPAVAGEVVTFYCGQKGRYLVVKIESSKFRSSVEMCRMRIYGINDTAPGYLWVGDLMNYSESWAEGPQWGQWSEYGECSVTCGTGVTIRTRSCFQINSGKVSDDQCPGNKEDFEDCSLNGCLSAAKSESKISGGAIAGIALGALAVLGACVAFAVFMKKKKAGNP